MKKTICLVLLAVLLVANKVQAEEKWEAFASTAMATSQVAPDGSVIVDNLVNQSYAEMSYGPITLFNWNNYDTQKQRFNEHDLGIYAKLFRVDAFSFYADLQCWIYPGHDYETAVSTGVKYTGWVDINFKLTRQSGHSNWEPGYRFWAEVSKKILLGKFSLTPKIQTAYLDNFFGVSGLAHITKGLACNYQITKKISLSGFLNHQTGFQMPNLWYGGVALAYFF
jgi:hypothetical protein